jgi:hypothetical protein
MRIKAKYLIIAAPLFLMWACKKSESENPYADIPPVVIEQPDLENLEPGNFAWLHAKIFLPTCANSGCHDGTFEPEFRSINSAYNTLVNHPVIANDLENSYFYRVVPGDAEASLLYRRLTEELPNSSGIMPLSLSEGSDWPANSASYISQIQQWILNGAKDMYGNAAPAAGADFPPQVEGIAVFPPGNTTNPYPREGEGPEITPFLIPAGTVDFWVSWDDDNTASNAMQSTAMKYQITGSEFEDAPEVLMNASGPISGDGFSGNMVNYHYKGTVDFSDAESGDTYFVRMYASDGVQPVITEIPNDGSSDLTTALFVVKIQ